MHCSLHLLATLGLSLVLPAHAANHLNLSNERHCGEFGDCVNSKRVEFRIQFGR